jgi:aryl-alcohol dehydrogenase-like predicted oxidoreductase
VGATPAQVALAWLRHRAETFGVASVPIPGTRRAARIDENLESLSVSLSAAQIERLSAAGESVSGDRYADMRSVGTGRE